jgi:hypothetical protein
MASLYESDCVAAASPNSGRECDCPLAIFKGEMASDRTARHTRMSPIYGTGWESRERLLGATLAQSFLFRWVQSPRHDLT